MVFILHIYSFYAHCLTVNGASYSKNTSRGSNFLRDVYHKSIWNYVNKWHKNTYFPKAQHNNNKNNNNAMQNT